MTTIKLHRILTALVLFAAVLAFGISLSYRLDQGFMLMLVSNFTDTALLSNNSLAKTAKAPVIRGIEDGSNFFSAGNQLL